jgi:hypothetical protein
LILAIYQIRSQQVPLKDIAHQTPPVNAHVSTVSGKCHKRSPARSMVIDDSVNVAILRAKSDVQIYGIASMVWLDKFAFPLPNRNTSQQLHTQLRMILTFDQ